MTLDTAVDSILRDLLVASVQRDGLNVTVDLYGGGGEVSDGEGGWREAQPTVAGLQMSLPDLDTAARAAGLLSLWALSDTPVVLVVEAGQRQVWMTDPVTGQTICLDSPERASN